MSKSEGIVLLLASVLLSVVLAGVVHAAGCTPGLETHICITTDKTTYKAGEAVIATVEEDVPPNTPNVTASIELFPMPPPCNYIYLSCATASGNVTLYPGPAGVWRGTVAIRLPDELTAGNYDVVVFSTLPAGWTQEVSAGITVTN